jgi:4-hydroxybutyryl-CoA dehydratase/vinylacetyl-CoA-Delta-isomerase
MKAGEDDYSVACMVPVNAPGVKIINTTYAPRHEDKRDFPISSRHHTPEGFVIFDDVFVPSERVFLAGNPELAGVFAHSLGLWERLGGLSGMATRYDALVGFAQLISEANGLERTSHIREKISEMLINATLIRATLEAAIENCQVTSDGAAFPDELYTNAGKYHGAANWSLMVRHLHDIAGGSILTAPGIADLENEEVGHLARKYMSTAQSVDGLYRARGVRPSGAQAIAQLDHEQVCDGIFPGIVEDVAEVLGDQAIGLVGQPRVDDEQVRQRRDLPAVAGLEAQP